MDDLFNFFCTELLHRYYFVVTKDKVEVLHLPDLLFQWCSISLTISGSAELVIQGRLWIHGRIVRSLRWYGRNLVTFGENCCWYNLNIKIVWYIKIFSLKWNFTRNLSKLSEFWPKKLKKLFKGSLAKKLDFFFFGKKIKKMSKTWNNQKSEKTVLKYMYLDGFGIFLNVFVHYNFFNLCSKLFWVKKHVFGDISKIQILAKNLPKI